MTLTVLDRTIKNDEDASTGVPMAFGVHDHPFYRPLIRRVIIVALTAAWAAVEAFYAKDGFWTVISVAVFAYCAWAFLLAYPKGEPK
jgi:hypothetical protein